MSTSTASAPDRLRSRVAAVSLAACEVVEEMIAHRAEVRTVSGLSVDVWLTCHSHLTRTERRAFQVAASALPTLPRVRAAFASGRLSWHLVQAITRAATRLTPDQRDILDGRLAIAMSEFAEADPTVLLDVLQAAMDDLRADLLRDAERRAERGEHLHVQPSLDGMGGTFNGRLGAVNFAVFMETLDAATTLPSLEANPHGDPRITWDNQTALAGARAEAFVKVVTSSGGGQARPKLIATVELETLLDLNRRSARILTTLIGGELRVTAATARRLADEAAGCSFRLVVTNDGQAIGVGRQQRFAPDWLRDAVLAFFPRCSRPGCNRPARQADIDHVLAWDDDGPTDFQNLRPLCRSHHTRKGRWQVTVRDDGTTLWVNRFTGDRLINPSSAQIRAIAEDRDRRLG